MTEIYGCDPNTMSSDDSRWNVVYIVEEWRLVTHIKTTASAGYDIFTCIIQVMLPLFKEDKDRLHARLWSVEIFLLQKTG
jgi:hypothetical protein